MSTAVLPCPPAVAAAPLLPLVGADTAVPLVPSGTARYVDLDAAASSRALASVAGRVQEALPLYASVHRGDGVLHRRVPPAEQPGAEVDHVDHPVRRCAGQPLHDQFSGRPGARPRLGVADDGDRAHAAAASRFATSSRTSGST